MVSKGEGIKTERFNWAFALQNGFFSLRGAPGLAKNDR